MSFPKDRQVRSNLNLTFLLEARVFAHESYQTEPCYIGCGTGVWRTIYIVFI